MTTGAFNALLKTLEEPPKHAIFILATTEPHKIPLTVLSRTQRYDFRKISNQAIIDRMTWIIGKESIDVEKEALDVIARVAQGGMRDALSLLDQAIAHSDGKVTLNDVIELTGTVELHLIGEMTKVLVERNTAKALDQLDEILDSGKEGKFLIDDLLSYFRDILVFRRIGDKANLTKAVTDRSFQSIANSLELARVYDVIEQLSKCQQSLKFTGNERITIEVSLMKITSLPTTDDFSMLSSEVDQLKKYLAGNGNFPINSENVVEVSSTETAAILPESPSEEIQAESMDNLVNPFDILNQIEDDLNSNSGETSLEHEPLVDSSDLLEEREVVLNSNDIAEGEVVLDSNDMSVERELILDSNDMPVEREVVLNPSDKPVELELEIDATEQGADIDLFALMENDLKDFSDIQEKELIQVDKPKSFLEQVDKDMADGATYIEVKDFNSLSDENVPPEVEDHSSNIQENTQPNTKKMTPIKSPSEDKVLAILSGANKTLKQNYMEIHEEVLSILKKERFTAMALYREAQVVAVNENSIVIVYKEKPKVQLFEKVINRSVVKSVIEEVTNQAFNIIAVSEIEWKSIFETYLAKK